MQPTFEIAGNRLRLLTEGPDRLEALIALIEGARTRLRLLYYIYTAGEVGTRIREALIAAARRGVRVSLIVDGLGSEAAAGEHFFDAFDDSGVELCRFVPRWGRRYLLRNHQKLALADADRAIIGGFNVADDYFGTEQNAAWRDLGLYIEGKDARDIAGYFDALADWAHRPRPPIRQLTRALRRWSEDGGQVRWLLGGPTWRLSPWARAIKRDMQRSRTIDLIAAYFAPNPAMLRRLDKAGRRGRVRCVLPSITDNYMAIWASRFTYAGLIRKGVEIYEYLPTKLHTKLFLVDDVVYLGSANFDIRSLYLNLELMLRIEDKAFAAHVRAYVDGEVARSERMTEALLRERGGWWTRTRQAAAYFVMATADFSLFRRLTAERDAR